MKKVLSFLVSAMIIVGFLGCSGIVSDDSVSKTGSVSFSLNPSLLLQSAARSEISRSVARGASAADVGYYYPRSGDYANKTLSEWYLASKEEEYEGLSASLAIGLFCYDDQSFFMTQYAGDSGTVYAATCFIAGSYSFNGNIPCLSISKVYTDGSWYSLPAINNIQVTIDGNSISFSYDNESYTLEKQTGTPTASDEVLGDEEDDDGKSSYEYTVIASLNGDYKTYQSVTSGEQNSFTITFDDIPLEKTVFARIDIYCLTASSESEKQFLHILTGTTDKVTIQAGKNSTSLKLTDMTKNTKGWYAAEPSIYAYSYDEASGTEVNLSCYSNGKYQIAYMKHGYDGAGNFNASNVLVSEGTWRADKSTKTLYFTECAYRKITASATDKATPVVYPTESEIDFTNALKQDYESSLTSDFTSASGTTFKFFYASTQL